jgi:hypothetical protein
MFTHKQTFRCRHSYYHYERIEEQCCFLSDKRTLTSSLDRLNRISIGMNEHLTLIDLLKCTATRHLLVLGAHSERNDIVTNMIACIVINSTSRN